MTRAVWPVRRATDDMEPTLQITLGQDLAFALGDAARREGVAPESLALHVLRERFLPTTKALEPRDEWERGLVEAAKPWGVSFSDDAVGSEGLYD